jgi:hypothetical protein
MVSFETGLTGEERKVKVGDHIYSDKMRLTEEKMIRRWI